MLSALFTKGVEHREKIMESKKTTLCEKCGKTGIVYVNNGQDDVDEDFCSCAIGHEVSAPSPYEVVESQIATIFNGLRHD